MATREQVDRLIADVAPLAEVLKASGYEGEDVWSVVVDEETLLIFDLDDARGCLTLSAEAAPIPAGERPRLYEVLLQYNFQGAQTGGVHLALDAPDGAVVLLAEIGVAGLDATRLSAFMAGFVERLRAWREVLGGWGARGNVADPVADGAFDPLAGMGALRV